MNVGAILYKKIFWSIIPQKVFFKKKYFQNRERKHEVVIKNHT